MKYIDIELLAMPKTWLSKAESHQSQKQIRCSFAYRLRELIALIFYSAKVYIHRRQMPRPSWGWKLPGKSLPAAMT